MKSLKHTLAALILAMTMCMALALPVSAATPIPAAASLSTMSASDNAVTLAVANGDNITNALKGALANNTTITIPAGSYTSGSVDLSNYHDLTIVATGATITRISSCNTPLLRSYGNPANCGVVIKGGTWDGAKVKAAVFRTDNGDMGGMSVQNATFCNSGDCGVIINSSSNISFTGCVFRNNGNGNLKQGFTARKSSGVTLSNCSAYQNGQHGIYFDGASATVSNTKVYSNYWCGLVASNSSVVQVKGGNYYSNGTRPDSTVKNADDYAAGLGVYSKSKLVVSGATLEKNHGSGVSVCGTKGALSTLSISNSVISANGDHGLAGHPYAKLNASGCTIKNNTTNGLMLMTGSSSDNISKCTITGNDKGITVGESSTAKSISNCKVNENKSIGIRVGDKSTAVISGGEANNNSGIGIGAYNKSKVTIKNVTIKKNKTFGINISASTSPEISGCTLDSNKDCGIRIGDGSTVTSVKNCKSNSNKNHGIYVAGKSSASLTSCTVQKNAKDGIRIVDSGTKASVSGGTVSENGACGIIVQKKAKVSTLKKVKIKKNAKYGIAVYKGCTVTTASGNTTSDNKSKQIYVEKGASTKLKTKK